MSADLPVTVAVRISGRVQGVRFRYWTARTARDLGLTGWVRNDPDGGVFAEFCGTQQLVSDMLTQCESGPEHANVRQIEKNFDGIAGGGPYEEFVILR